LALANNKINDVSGLKELTNLTYLTLMGDQVDDISILKGLKNLKELQLQNNYISKERLDELRTALPDCNIRID
jgi:internalin A